MLILNFTLNNFQNYLFKEASSSFYINAQSTPLLIMLPLMLSPIIAVFYEEIMFRNLMLESLKFKKQLYYIIIVIILNSIAFSLAHMSINISAFLMSIVSCCLVMLTKSLWAPLILHFANNGIMSVITTFLYLISLLNPNRVIVENEEPIVSNISWQQALTSLIISSVIFIIILACLICLYLIIKHKKRKQAYQYYHSNKYNKNLLGTNDLQFVENNKFDGEIAFSSVSSAESIQNIPDKESPKDYFSLKKVIISILLYCLSIGFCILGICLKL